MNIYNTHIKDIDIYIDQQNHRSEDRCRCRYKYIKRSEDICRCRYKYIKRYEDICRCRYKYIKRYEERCNVSIIQTESNCVECFRCIYLQFYFNPQHRPNHVIHTSTSFYFSDL